MKALFLDCGTQDEWHLHIGLRLFVNKLKSVITSYSIHYTKLYETIVARNLSKNSPKVTWSANFPNKASPMLS